MMPMRTNDASRSAEWRTFEANVADLRRLLERGLRRELVHDPRAAKVRIQNLSVADLADEAITWGLENWRAQPAATSPDIWVRKRALQLLDEALDAESLAAESRAEERAAERRHMAHDLMDDGDDEERTAWLDMAGLATRTKKHEKDGGEDEPFDGLESDPQVSSPEERLDERELIAQMERALLALPDCRRRIVSHRYLDGLTVEEIAYIQDMSKHAVQLEIVTGLRELQLALKGS
jgi:DNA-directed RNA polymerase specialized sigma24 family protein